MGYGWGVCVRMPGDGQMPVRAVCIMGHELGMTQFARLIAATLGMRLGPGCSYHLGTEVGDMAVDTRIQLVL
eukprot:5619186-Prymnesium_polylepis.1